MGCIIIDPPAGFELADLVQCLVNITTELPGPFTIVLYSQWSFKKLDNAVKTEEKLRSSKLALTEFLMLKVRASEPLAHYPIIRNSLLNTRAQFVLLMQDTFASSRTVAGSQPVVIIATPGAKLHLTDGSPIRYFAPLCDKVSQCDDIHTDDG